jgi:FkbM family methyltransferase
MSMNAAQTLPEQGFFARLSRAFRHPWRSTYILWSRVFPNTPLLLRLPFGVWWLAGNDYSGSVIRDGSFENSEFRFVQRYLEAGMTVLDIGAHHGFYTLLSATRIGRKGRIYAFEPSPRERAALLRHVKWNRLRNVSVYAVALGMEAKTGHLFVVDQHQTGCNSLRPPASDVLENSTPTPVDIIRLDDWASEQHLASADFIKLDVEGGELDVLKGANMFLERRPRPVFLIEVQEIRTENWGYRAREIIRLLADRGFRWFSMGPDGSLRPLNVDLPRFEGNYVAWPEERDPQRLAGFLRNH